jgi:hypothetical protein
MNPVETLRDGAAELAPALTLHGFQFVPTGSGVGSGGHYATGEFRRGDRRLELHFRYSLGLVAYHIGAESLSHAELVRAVVATQSIQHPAQYPGFSEDPSKGFGTFAQTSFASARL